MPTQPNIAARISEIDLQLRPCVGPVLLLSTLLAAFASLAAQENPDPSAPILAPELRDLIAEGDFHAAIAATTGLASDADYERRFLADVAEDFARMARAEAAGARTMPVGKRLRHHGGRYYTVFEETMNFESAEEIARSLGGSLAEIASADLQSYLVTELLMPAQQRSDADSTRTWTGMTGIIDGTEWTWQLSDGSPMAFEMWDSGHPRKFNDDLYAVVLHSDAGGKWRSNERLADNNGNPTDRVIPMIEWIALPAPEETGRDIAHDATAPLRPVKDFPPFATLRKQAAAAVKKNAAVPAHTQFQALLDKYAAAVEKAEAAATEAGELAQVVAFRNESRHLSGVKTLSDLPAFAIRPASAAVAGLRSEFLKNASSIREERGERVRAVLSTYRETLGEIEKKLTVAYRIPDALSIRHLRNDLAAILGEQAEKVTTTAASITETKSKLQLDIPDRDWPRDVYDPGKPGKLRGIGTTYPGDKPIDLSPAAGIDDIVKIATVGQGRGWVALRADGSLVSTEANLHGRSGVWRMIPKQEDGAIFFWEDDTVTRNTGSPLEVDGSQIPASQVAWVSDVNNGTLVTMKDGAVHLLGDEFDKTERGEIEKAFTGVDKHVGYRYGVTGLTSDGKVATAVLAARDRMNKEGAKRLPGVAHDSYERIEFVDLFGRSGDPIFLTAREDLWKMYGGWFPNKPRGLSEVGDEVEPKAKSDIVSAWPSNFHVTLSKRGKWFVVGKFEVHPEFDDLVAEVLENQSGPIGDIRLYTISNENDAWAAQLLWTE